MPEISTMAEVAETIRSAALALADADWPPAQCGASLAARLASPEYVSRLRYGLTLAVARVLAANDHRVVAVYSFEPPPGGDCPELAPPGATLRLLVVVTAPSAALSSFIESLDRALAANLRGLPSAPIPAHDSVLDVTPISEDELHLGHGFAVLMRSGLRAQGSELWARGRAEDGRVKDEG